MNGALASTAARKAAQSLDIGMDYPGILGGIASGAGISDMPGHAVTGGGYQYDGLGGYMDAIMNALGGADWGNIALAGGSLALRGLANHSDRSTSSSRSTSTLGPSVTTDWSPSTKALMKMLDGMQAGWTKYGK